MLSSKRFFCLKHFLIFPKTCEIFQILKLHKIPGILYYIQNIFENIMKLPFSYILMIYSDFKIIFV